MAAAVIQLVPGALDAAAKSETDGPLTLKVADFGKSANGKWTCTVTDGSQKLKGVLASQIGKQIESGSLVLNEGAVIRTERYNINQVQDGLMCIIPDVEILQQGDGSSAAAAAAAASDAAGGTKADQQATPQGAAKQQPRTPANTPSLAAAGAAGRALQTPGPAPSPSEEIKGTPAMTPASSMQQPSFTPMSTVGKAAGGGAAAAGASPLAVAERAGAQPIAALNPYQKNWVIKAMVTRKSLMRTFNKGAADNKVFDVELADSMGTQIQGSFWRESADKFYDSLQEGKVYYFSNFVVKPANKQFATVRNDYQITFDARTEITEARDQGSISSDVVQVDLVPLDKLARHIGRKAPIDVLGVVTAVGPIGTVKRKADNSELMKRELTLADSSKLSVALTLWGDNATRPDLDHAEGKILQVTSVKANEFNGCSLSGLTRSKVTVDPDSQEAAELRTWWEAEGRTATITPLGQTLQGGAGGGASGARRNKLELLSAVTPDGPLPAPDAKPTYHDVVATFVQLLEERPIMYLANPANGKKVVAQDGRYWCEGDGVYIDVPEQRYMLTAKVADASGEVYVTVFNEQGAQLLGCSADEAAAKQENDPQAFKSLLQQTQWSEWKMTLAARSREYNGERRMRCSVQRMSPMDYAAEGHRLLQLITQPQQ